MAQTREESTLGEERRAVQGTQQAISRSRPWAKLLTLPTWVWCIVVGGVALGFDLYRLGDPSIWYDEAFSVELARLPLPQLWHIIWGPEPNMELYFLFLHGWLGLTSLVGLLPTEFVVRFPCAVFAALSSVVVFLLGKRYFGLTAGVVGAGLYLLNDLQLVYAQQTRSYSLELLLVCVGWYALFAAISAEPVNERAGKIRRGTTGDRKGTPLQVWWVCYVVAMALAVYAHLFSGLMIVAQLVAFGGLIVLPGPWRGKARGQLRPFILSLVVCGLVIIPMLLVSLHGSRTSWLPVPHRSDLVYLFMTIGDQNKSYLLLVAACCAFALAIGLLVWLPQRVSVLKRWALKSESDEARLSQLQRLLALGFAFASWIVVPTVVSYVISKGPIRMFSPRYLVPIVPPIFLLVGLAVSVFRWRLVQVVLALGLLLVTLQYVPQYYASAQVEDWNTTNTWLEQHYQAGDGLVCYNNAQGCQVPVDYYFYAYPTSAHFTADSPGSFAWDTYGSAEALLIYQQAVDPNALAPYAAKHSRIIFIKGRVADNTQSAQVDAAVTWLGSHYHLVDKFVTPTVTVWLYTTA